MSYQFWVAAPDFLSDNEIQLKTISLDAVILAVRLVVIKDNAPTLGFKQKQQE